MAINSFAIAWLASFLAFPIGGLLSMTLIGGVTTPLKALLSGLLTGAVIGFSQWLVLRFVWPIPVIWIAAASVGFGVGLAAAVAAYGPDLSLGSIIARALIAGLGIAVLQGVVLSQVAGSTTGLLWAAVVATAWPLAWTVTRAIGVDLAPNFAVFGAAGALTFQVVTMTLISILRP